MDQESILILIMTGLVIATVFGLWAYGANTGNYQLLGYFCVGSIIMFLFVYPAIEIFKSKQHYQKEKSNNTQVYVEKKKELPIYAIGLIEGFGLFFAISVFLIYVQYKEKNVLLFEIFIIIALLGMIACYILFRQKKMLYLIKDNSRVIQYEIFDPYYSGIFELYQQLTISMDEVLVRNKCERIILDNNVNIWSCFAKTIGAKLHSHYYSYIFAKIVCNIPKDISIVMNNNTISFLSKPNVYMTKYSNLPPFLIKGEGAEKICNNIEESCSEFFSKIRFNYVLEIQDGKISIGLKNARFGRFNRLFKQKITIDYIEEAVDEISNFLLNLKNIIEQ